METTNQSGVFISIHLHGKHEKLDFHLIHDIHEVFSSLENIKYFIHHTSLKPWITHLLHRTSWKPWINRSFFIVWNIHLHGKHELLGFRLIHEIHEVLIFNIVLHGKHELLGFSSYSWNSWSTHLLNSTSWKPWIARFFIFFMEIHEVFIFIENIKYSSSWKPWITSFRHIHEIHEVFIFMEFRGVFIFMENMNHWSSWKTWSTFFIVFHGNHELLIFHLIHDILIAYIVLHGKHESSLYSYLINTFFSSNDFRLQIQISTIGFFIDTKQMFIILVQLFSICSKDVRICHIQYFFCFFYWHA